MDNMSSKGQVKGRPLSTEVADAVFKAALDLIEESGLEQITRLQIANRAQVSRQTLYNRWASVGDIVLDALVARGEREIGGKDQGEVKLEPRAALREYVSGLAEALQGWAAPGLKAVAALAQQDAKFGQRFRHDFIARRHGRLLQAVTEACDKPAQNPLLIAEFIAASMWYRLLISGQALDQGWVDAMLAQLD